MKKIKLGFIGAGFMGQRAHLRNYAALDDCEMVALAEARPILARETARVFGIPNIFTTHNEMISACSLDAIVAIQHFSHHINTVPDILNAGISILTEKPLCISAENGKRLVEMQKETGSVYMVGYHKRSDPAMEYAKALIADWIQSGEYGAMRYVRMTMPPGDWISGNPKGIETDEAVPVQQGEALPLCFEDAAGKAYSSFINYYIHQINALRFVLGEPYKLVFADRSKTLLVAESVGGVCCTLEMSPYSTTIDWQESIFIAFEKGTIRIDLPAPLVAQTPGKVTVLRDGGKAMPSITQPLLPPVSAMQNQAANFLKAVRGEMAPPCDAAEALEDLKIAAAYIKMLY
jgi:predicted dehydrogenase